MKGHLKKRVAGRVLRRQRRRAFAGRPELAPKLKLSVVERRRRQLIRARIQMPRRKLARLGSFSRKIARCAMLKYASLVYGRAAVRLWPHLWTRIALGIRRYFLLKTVRSLRMTRTERVYRKKIRRLPMHSEFLWKRFDTTYMQPAHYLGHQMRIPGYLDKRRRRNRRLGLWYAHRRYTRVLIRVRKWRKRLMRLKRAVVVKYGTVFAKRVMAIKKSWRSRYFKERLDRREYSSFYWGSRLLLRFRRANWLFENSAPEKLTAVATADRKSLAYNNMSLRRSAAAKISIDGGTTTVVAARQSRYPHYALATITAERAKIFARVNRGRISVNRERLLRVALAVGWAGRAVGAFTYHLKKGRKQRINHYSALMLKYNKYAVFNSTSSWANGATQKASARLLLEFAYTEEPITLAPRMFGTHSYREAMLLKHYRPILTDIFSYVRVCKSFLASVSTLGNLRSFRLFVIHASGSSVEVLKMFKDRIDEYNKVVAKELKIRHTKYKPDFCYFLNARFYRDRVVEFDGERQVASFNASALQEYSNYYVLGTCVEVYKVMVNAIYLASLNGR